MSIKLMNIVDKFHHEGHNNFNNFQGGNIFRGGKCPLKWPKKIPAVTHELHFFLDILIID